MANSEYNAKNIKKAFSERGCFYTDSRLAELMMAELGETDEAYDPTCGDGQLLSVFPDSVKKYGQEIDPQQLENARARLVNFEGVAADTLKEPAFMDRRFKAIIANPPFSIKWEPQENDPRFSVAPCLPPPSKADYAFILHIVHLLADDGKAVVLNFPGILYRGQREGKIREWLVRQNYIEKVIHIEGGYFEDTNIATALLVIRKHRDSTDIEFVDHEHGISDIVPFEQVEAEGFNLSVSTYVQPKEPEKEKVDPVQLELLAQRGFLRKLRAEIQMSLFACKMEGMDVRPFLAEIKKVVASVEREVTQGKQQLKLFK
jgi:type I restriction-modification system DNA methylase subunit